MDDQTPPSALRPGDDARAETIALRITREKTALIDQLKKIPIVQVACEKVGISRATFYNWKKDDAEFATSVDEAIGDGTGFVNDMAESQLLSAIKEGNLGAITYWLKHRHSAYSNRLEVTTKTKTDTDTLTPEQEEAVRHALQMATFTASTPTAASPISSPPPSNGPESSGDSLPDEPADRADAERPQGAA